MQVGVSRAGTWRWSYAVPAAAAFTAVAWVMQVLLGRNLPTWAYYALLACGSLSALLAVLLQLRQSSIEQKGRLEAQALAEKTVEAYKLQIGDMLIPLSVVVTDIIAGNGQDRRDAQQTLCQSVVDLAAGEIGPGRTRACFFKYVDGSPRKLVRKNWKGRNRQPRPKFVEGTPEGSSFFRLVDNRAWEKVDDVDTAQLPGWNGGSEYKTFICTTVGSENHVYGILTLDSLQAGDLSDDDLLLMRLLAQLLAIGLSAG